MMAYGDYAEMMGGFGWLWMLLVLGVVIALVVLGTRTALWSRRDTGEPTPLDTLRSRYARGEITAPEFEEAKRAIA